MDQKQQSLGSSVQMDQLIDLMADRPPISLSRNDLCSCGSSKKYKNCCLKTERRRFSPGTLTRQVCTITSEPLTPEESQEEFPRVSSEDEEILSSLYHDIHEHPETIKSDSGTFFQQANALREKYPNSPVILNYMIGGYQLLGQEEKADALIDEAYERFPNYLFSQIAMATRYLADNDLDKAIQVFKGAHSLQTLYPNRTVFHISEARGFFYFMTQYFCKRKNVKQAEAYLKILEGILPEDDAAIQKARHGIRHAKGCENFKACLSRLLGRSRR